MLLVQQPQHPSSVSFMSSKPFGSPPNHRRNPSAPAAVVQGQVQPTKTPGLLSLSKPPAPRQPRHATPRQPRSKPQQVPQQRGLSPENRRGRNNSSKDKAARAISKPRAGHGARGRQASPSPFPQPEQASTVETVATPSLSKSDSTTPIVSKSGSPTPTATVLSAPSGRLAKRRNRVSIPFPSSTSTPLTVPKDPKRSQSPFARAKPVPVPVKAKVSSLPISKSDPVLPHFPRVPARRDGNGGFPICDDNDDKEEDDGLERPSTPSPVSRKDGSRTWQQTSLFNPDVEQGGPRTAPVSMNEGVAKQFFPSPVPSPSRAYHKRTPSVPADGMFELSFGSDSELNISDMSALFGRASSHRPLYDGSVRSTSTPLRKPEPSFKFASPMFQNSPSPEHLPPPTFSLAKMKKALVAQAN